MDRFTYILFLGFYKFIMFLSPKNRLKLFSFFSKLALKLNSKHRKIVYTNLKISFGNSLSEEEKYKILVYSYKNLFFNVLSLIENFTITDKELKKRIKFINLDYMTDAIKKKKKIIITSAHYGNWELCGAGISRLISPMCIVYKEASNPYFDNLINKARQKVKMTVIEKDGAVRKLYRCLKENIYPQLMVDQNTATYDGILVDFFGKKVRQAPTISYLSRKLDALIIPAYNTTDDGYNYTIKFLEPFVCEKTDNKEKDILACTQKQTSIFENLIKEEPKFWFWQHRRWKNTNEDLYK